MPAVTFSWSRKEQPAQFAESVRAARPLSVPPSTIEPLADAATAFLGLLPLRCAELWGGVLVADRHARRRGKNRADVDRHIERETDDAESLAMRNDPFDPECILVGPDLDSQFVSVELEPAVRVSLDVADAVNVNRVQLDTASLGHGRECHREARRNGSDQEFLGTPDAFEPTFELRRCRHLEVRLPVCGRTCQPSSEPMDGGRKSESLGDCHSVLLLKMQAASAQARLAASVRLPIMRADNYAAWSTCG